MTSDRQKEELAEQFAAAFGSEVDKDVGIANQHRARLKARIAGNVASGLARFVWTGPSGDPRHLAGFSCSVAEAILRECGL